MNIASNSFKIVKQMLRAVADKMLAPRGLAITSSRLELAPTRQLALAIQHFDISAVLDIGANSGQFAQELLKAGYSGDIWSVEPLPDAHKHLRTNAESHPNLHVMDPVALGSEEGTIEIVISGNSYSSSVLEMTDRHIAAAPHSAPVNKIEVKQMTLDSLFSNKNWAGKNLLLKIDTQGYEYAILQGAHESLRHTDLVLLELSLQSLYKDQMLWLELINYMQQQGFEVWSIQPEFCDPISGQLLQVNGIFSRAPQT